MQTINGQLIAKNCRIAIIASRFNELIVNKLISGAEDALVRHGVAADDISLYWVPGAFEIPPLAHKLANCNHYDAIICLGAVIRGSTPHFDYVCAEVSKGVAQTAMQANCPVIFGVLTTENISQAIERAGTKAGNKGFDAAMAAIEMTNLYRRLEDLEKAQHQ